MKGSTSPIFLGAVAKRNAFHRTRHYGVDVYVKPATGDMKQRSVRLLGPTPERTGPRRNTFPLPPRVLRQTPRRDDGISWSALNARKAQPHVNLPFRTVILLAGLTTGNVTGTSDFSMIRDLYRMFQVG